MQRKLGLEPLEVFWAQWPHILQINGMQKKNTNFRLYLLLKNIGREVDGLSSLPSGYGRIGRISPIIHERVYNLALTRHEEAKRNWKKFKWNVIKSHELVSPDAAPYGLIHDTLSARIFPSKACASLAQACSFMGVEFRENTYVSNFDTGVISGSWGNETASSIIIATGYEGFDSLEKFFPTSMGSGVKGQAALLNIMFRRCASNLCKRRICCSS